MDNQFDQKVAIVTGGASGIGEAIVRDLVAAGARTVIADYDAKGAEALAGELGDNAAAYTVNVADPEAVEAMVGFTLDTFGGLDMAVNNAGISGAEAPTAEQSIDDWQRVIDVNLNSVFYCMKYQIPAMLDQGGGAIVNMASMLGTVGFPGAAGYVAAKHGVIGMTRTAALEYSAQGIRINAVGPGFIATPLVTNALDEETRSQLAEAHAVGRLGKTEEIAALTLFLLSPAASFITGSIHLADGGYTAR